MFDKGSTAVLSTPDLPFIVAVKKTGLYTFDEGEWHLQYALSHNIYKLVHIGSYIFGIGDNGTIVRYNSLLSKWVHTSFPTSQRLWDITGNEQGLIITHGGSKLYISNNFGLNWSVIKPFEAISAKPTIRSLHYHQGHIYIGTQINRDAGGLWRYSLTDGELLLVKKETSSMISSIYMDLEDCLFITKGYACSDTGEGSLEMMHAHTGECRTFHSVISEKAFLDVFTVNNKLYTTTSKDAYGFSRIYEIQKETQTLLPIETVIGHGFRGAGFNDQLFISSPVESKWICSRSKQAKLLH
ncbi:MAG: hypothetical protein ACI35P_16265 [Bacillus sp. (in: firmicutes)]